MIRLRRGMGRGAGVLVAALLGVAFRGVPCGAQLDHEKAPISYHQTESRDAVARLQERLDAGRLELAHDLRHGYLPALLEELDVPRSSQTLVFSQTSRQLRQISPARPRAIYFNDESYVGWVQGGDMIELAAVDPQLGAVFYTLDVRKAGPPRIVRDRGQCLSCHAGDRTQDVPGLLVRSVYPGATGRPLLNLGSFVTDDRSDFRERWGGWYVTGQHGSMRHMGNRTFDESVRNPRELSLEDGANHDDLKGRVDTRPYLEASSDIVALMVLEHQTQTHNALTFASQETRSVVAYDQMMNEALERDPGHRSDVARRRIQRALDRLVRALFFVGEFALQAEVRGRPEFVAAFQARGRRDAKGRSLRDLDLRRRLFVHPCSFLIHSASFRELPDEIRGPLHARIASLLEDGDPAPEYAHLDAATRRAIRRILIETHEDEAFVRALRRGA